MAPHCNSPLLLLLLLTTIFSFLPLFTLSMQPPNLHNQSHFLALMKQSLSGPAMSRWDLSASVCDQPGILCDHLRDIVSVDISGWSVVGDFPPGVCSFIPKLRSLRLSRNDIRNGFPSDVVNCSFLEDLNMSYSGLSGPIPDLSPMHSLRSLDLRNNFLSGEFPISSLVNMSNLRLINFNENPGFRVWRLPESITRLENLQVLVLSTSCMRGEIPSWIGNMTSLTDLELSGNFLTGAIPASLGKLKHLQFLELYYNRLAGEIPPELGNLTELVDLDLSANELTGKIPESLCQLPELGVLQLYSNKLTGGIPRSLANSTSLTILSIYRNFLSGEVSPDLGKRSELIVLELSENRFSGPLPAEACARGQLLYFLVLGNLFSGTLPETYAYCRPLLRFRVNDNQLTGAVPEGIFGLPHASIIDLGFNIFQGTIPKSIGNAKNLSGLFLQDNQFSGQLPAEIGYVSALVKLDVSNNRLTGPIPMEIGSLSKLNQLSLQGNRLDSAIPSSLSMLKSLNVLNLSNNLLTGEIPHSLCELLPNSLDFSNNHLSGAVPLPLVKEGLIESVAGNPQLCIPIQLNLTDPVLPLCPQPGLRKRLGNVWVAGLSVTLAMLGVALVTKRWLANNKAAVDQDGSPGISSSSSFSYDVTSFHKISFNQNEIVEAMVDKNIIGRGGSGTVYRIELSRGEWVAVKKLADKKAMCMDKELRSEVETLGSIRHKNIVKLYCCFSSADNCLLVYEYMPNGNLWDALHRGWSCFLDWPTRHRIAVGVAQGLAYLHHDLLFPILHRDIKTSNILLDAEFEPKVADFGIAKVLQARGEHDSTTTVVAGTCGYLAPEYAYSSKATTKCDVYSFGVVVTELVTGKKPSEPEFGESRDIIQWVSAKMATKEGAMEALDKRLAWSPFKEEMIHVLRIALRCTCSSPNLRPSMNEVVQLLVEADPFRPDGRVSSSFKLKEWAPPTKTKNCA